MAGHATCCRLNPKTQSRLLYRGTIWVDEDDFAVVKIES